MISDYASAAGLLGQAGACCGVALVKTLLRSINMLSGGCFLCLMPCLACFCSFVIEYIAQRVYTDLPNGISVILLRELQIRAFLQPVLKQHPPPGNHWRRTVLAPASCCDGNDKRKMTDKTSPQLEQDLAAADRQAWYQLTFPPVLEEAYLHATCEQRLRRYRLFGAIGIVVFMLYGLVDKFYLADAYGHIWLWRWLILPGMGAISIIGSYWVPLRRWYELSVVGVSTACVLALTWFFSLSQMPTAQHYYGGVMLCLVFTMFGLRIPFRLACYSSVISLSYLGWVLLGWHFLDEATRSLIFILVISCVLLGLLGLFQLEKEARRSYLLAQELQRDHLQLQQGFKYLQQISTADGLTGLFNRRYFDQQLQAVWESRLQNKADIALLFVDVDYFKKYNDSQGHQMGDDALIRVAQVISRHAESVNGCAARYGGEEFVLLLACSTVGQASRLAEQIRQDVEALALPHPSSLCSKVVTISIGIAAAHASINQKPDWLVSTADAAVYQAKKQGRNRIVTMHSCQPLPG